MATSMAIISAFVFLNYQSTYREIEDKYGLSLEHIARTTALNIDAAKHGLIRKKGDENLPEFDSIRSYLKKVQEANGLAIEEIYTFTVTANKALRFAVMLQPEPFTGETYKPLAVRKVINRVLLGKAAHSGIYKSKTGEYVSAFAPLISRGVVTGILEVDYKISKFLTELRQKMQKVVYLALGLIMAILLASLFISARIVRPVKELKRAAHEVTRGNYNTIIDIDTNDELRDLTNAFNQMASQLLDSSQQTQASIIENARKVEESSSDVKKTSVRLKTAAAEQVKTV